MNKRNFEFKIGIMVLTVVVVLVILVFQFGRQSFVSRGPGYDINVHFDKAPGIKTETPVFKSGVQIGVVRSANLEDSESQTYVDVVLQINKDRKIFSNEACRINVPLVAIGGPGTTLEIVKIRDYPGPVVELKQSQTIPGIIPVDMMQTFGGMEGDVTKTIQQIGEAAEKVAKFIENTSSMLGTPEEMKEKQDRFLTLIDHGNTTMETIQRLADNINAIFEDDRVSESIQQVVTTIPETMEQAKAVLDNINMFVTDAKATVDQANVMISRVTSNLGNLDNFTSSLGIEGPDMVRSLARASRRIEGVFDDVAMLTSSLQNPNGSLGQLMNNPELYNSVLNTVENVEQLSASLRPIMNDMRVFSDKVARDPGMLGVRGALSPNPPLKGLPFGDGTDSDGLFSKRRDKVSPTHAIIQASYTPYPGEEAFEQQRWKAQLLPPKKGLASWTQGPEFEYVPVQSPLRKTYSSVQARQMQSHCPDDLDGTVYYEGNSYYNGRSGQCSADYDGNGHFWDGQEMIGSDENVGIWSPDSRGETVGDFNFTENGFSEDFMSDDFFSGDVISGNVMSGNRTFENSTFEEQGKKSMMLGNGGANNQESVPQPRQIPSSPRIGSPVVPKRSSVSPVPSFGQQPRTQTGEVPTMPTTILEFRQEGAMIEGATGEVIESIGPTSYIPGNNAIANDNPGVTFPTRDRGYIIEFETGLPTESLASAESAVSPVSAPNSAVVHSPTSNRPNSSVFPLETVQQTQTVQQHRSQSAGFGLRTGTTQKQDLQKYGSLKSVQTR
ncbi:MAG: MlaD family protein [Thermoguttaceae bacterium]